MTFRQQARKRKREKDDSYELESQRRKYPNHDTYTPVLEGLNALALVSDAPGHTELDNAIAKKFRFEELRSHGDDFLSSTSQER